ncbi:hypothetical protein M3Y94_00572300 [Aphelenchoides besseyi]|nr:hypothetical protein M3Y94_00572300 [Aphelenchoides besseyi]
MGLRSVLTITLILLFMNETNAVNLVTGCSSHCTLADKGAMKCWNQTLDFFSQILLGQIRAYILTEANVAMWTKTQGKQVDWNQMSSSTVKHMLDDNPPDIEDENGITDEEVYQKVVDALMDNSKSVYENYQSNIPLADCPLGCEKTYDSFRTFFIASASLSVGLFGLLVGLSMLRYRRVKRSVQKEALEALRNYELNAAHRKKQTFKLVDVNI